MKALLRECRGTTLAELLVSVTILGIIVGIMGTTLWQSLIANSEVSDDGLAINEVRKGLSWFAEDVKGAKNAAIDGTCGTGTLTLTWEEYPGSDPVVHTICYSVVGDELRRTVDGVTHTVAYNVVSGSVVYSICCSGDTPPNRNVGVTFQVDFNGTLRDLSVEAHMRPVP